MTIDIVLVPGLWLNASTWDRVVPALLHAGHRPHPLTLPGMESKGSDRTGITLEDHVAAVVAAIDAVTGPVLLVGHSAGCGIGYAAIDRLPGRVARAVYVGGFPTPDGSPIVDGFTPGDGEVGMPDWVAVGEAASIRDLDDVGLARLYAEAIPVPERVVTDMQRLRDARRYDVPVVAVCPEFSADDLRDWVTQGNPAVSEFAKIHNVEYVDLPGGHWPQLSQPDKLAAVILDAAARAE